MTQDLDVISVESSSRFRRSDFIVLVTVLMLLGALITPAILAAREGAQRNQCASNLRVLSLGVQNHADAYTQFPLGTVDNRELSPPDRFSWYLPLWRFIEGKPPELQVDTNQAWHAEVNRSPQLRRVHDLDPRERMKSYPLNFLPTFSCPGASRSLRVNGSQATQYVGMAGLGKNAPELANGDSGTGIWGYDRTTAVNAVTDGTSHTMLIVETNQETGPWFAGGPPTVRGLDTSATPLVRARGQFGGIHRTIPVAMVDASIRQLDSTIDIAVFSALATIAGEE